MAGVTLLCRGGEGRRETHCAFSAALAGLAGLGRPASLLCWAGGDRERAATVITTIGLTVNDHDVEVSLEARETLLDVLRHRLGLTGAHAGCEQGACGACTILLDGEVARSCLVLGVQAAGHRVTTIEAVGEPDRLHPVQAAFRDHHGLQCGFCTAAMVLAAIDLLARNAAPDDGEVRDALAGNLCRCTGYSGIVAAVRSLAAEPSGAG